MSFYHDRIITVPHDNNADFGLELEVNSIFFHLYPCVVVRHLDTKRQKVLLESTDLVFFAGYVGLHSQKAVHSDQAFRDVE